MHYINMPVLFNFYPQDRFALKGGVQLGVLLSATDEGLQNGSFVSRKTTGEHRRVDVAIPVGMSYQFGDHYMLDLRYTIGLKKTREFLEVSQVAGSVTTRPSKNNAVALTFGYKF